MLTSAKLRYLRIAPRKVRLVGDSIRGKKTEEAKDILKFTLKKGADPFLKLLNSAVANARINFQADPENLYISQILVDEGPKYKRWRPRARGQAYPIQKKTSHITIVLAEIEKGKKKEIVLEKETKKEIKEEKKTIKPKPDAIKEEKKPKNIKAKRRFFQRKSI